MTPGRGRLVAWQAALHLANDDCVRGSTEWVFLDGNLVSLASQRVIQTAERCECERTARMSRPYANTSPSVVLRSLCSGSLVVSLTGQSSS
jgi:hypothetical protein